MPRNGISTKAVIGSACHKSNAAFALTPNRVRPDTQIDATFLQPSSRNAALAIAVAQTSFARVSRMATANDAALIATPRSVASGLAPASNSWVIAATAMQMQN